MSESVYNLRHVPNANNALCFLEHTHTAWSQTGSCWQQGLVKPLPA